MIMILVLFSIVLIKLITILVTTLESIDGRSVLESAVNSYLND